MARAKGRSARHVPARASSITEPRVLIEQRLDYGGVRIINPPSVHVRRLLPGRGARAAHVEMDIRSFVPSRPSSVVSRFATLSLERAFEKHRYLSAALPEPRQPSWFDTIAHLLADTVFEEIPYQRRDGAAWQLPEETLALGRGDCEDRATLLGSALVAAGISPYNVRVALGTIESQGSGRTRRHAHCWVVYRSESGGWAALEPVASGGPSRHSRVGFKYDAELVFNGDHQWSTHALDSPEVRRRWNALDPTFHGEVHRNIIADAAARAGLPEPVRSRMSRTFTLLFGNVVDEPDLAKYDPRHHFDSGLIRPAWRHVRGWLQKFYDSPVTDSEGTRAACWAAHAIADFYAHSSYAHFLLKERNALIPYDPISQKPALTYDYANDPEYQAAALSYYPKWYLPTMFDRFARWKGTPISGRYSFPGDSNGFIERFVNKPPADAFPTPAARALAGSLPHHDEIAVDEESGKNKLYGPKRYAEQYQFRYALAVLHISQVLKKRFAA